MLAEEEAALAGPVATPTARDAPPEEVFAAVTEEIGQLLALGFAYLGRFEPDNALTTVAAWLSGPLTLFRPGTPVILGGKERQHARVRDRPRGPAPTAMPMPRAR